MSPRRPISAILLDASYVLVGGLLATAVAWPIYQHPQALLVGAAGTLLGAGIALIGRLTRLAWWVDGLIAVAAYLAVAVPLAIPGSFPGRWLDGLRDAVVGVVVGWKQLVTLDLPLGTYQAVLIPLLVVTLFGAYAATRIAVTAGRAIILSPLLLVAMLGFGIAFGTSEIVSSEPYRTLPALPGIGRVPTWVVLVVAGLLLVVLIIVWFVLRARQERRAALERAAGVAQTAVRVHRGSGGAVLRRGGLAAGMLIVAFAVAGAIAVPALELDREVIRDGMQPIELSSPEASPLGAYRQWMLDERYDAELFAVTTTGDVDRLRLVVLDEYDGTRFHVADPDGASRFTRLVSPGPVAGGTARIEVRDGYRGPWLPIPGDLAEAADYPVDHDRALALEDRTYYAIDGSNAVVLIEDDTGAVGLRTGDVVVTSGATVAEARTAIAGADGGDPIHGIDEDTYPELVRWVASQRASSGGAGLLDVIDALRARGYLSHALLADEGASWVMDASARVSGFQVHESRAGHSVSRLEALFAQLTERQRQVVGASGVLAAGTNEAALVAGIGDDEQFAAAGALLAWSLGFDARVVIGVHLAETDAMLPPGGGPPAIEACDVFADGTVCAGRNVGAWIEVLVGGEWLPLDTSPQFANPPRADREGELPPPHGTQPERPVSSVVDPPDATPADGDAGAAPEDPLVALPGQVMPLVRIIGVAVGVVGLLALPAAFLLAAKALRRHRRWAADPETAIVGAWDELIDLAIDHRVLDAEIGTRRRLAARLGDPAAERLAVLADRAVFGERAPSDTDREAAWAHLADAREDLREGVPFWHRVRAALAPTSFIRHLGARSPVRTRSTSSRGTSLAGEMR